VLTVVETGSTNADLLRLAASGAVQGTWLVAERQTAGRGRDGRQWQSPAGNLHASVLVRLRPSDPPAPTLALVAGVAVEEAVRMLLPVSGLRLKWPNDLLINGEKLAGILLERERDAIVAGFGVNLRHAPALPDRATTSLADHGVEASAPAFARALAEVFGRWRARWGAEGLEPVRRRWLERAHGAGTPLAARLPDGAALAGTFGGLAADGALQLRLADGETRAIHAGDVFLA
jgi:BirA family transcriptional regulator, biotin operon repressor / biotin---[acetyl-CoA-carboxylase] ligase